MFETNNLEAVWVAFLQNRVGNRFLTPLFYIEIDADVTTGLLATEQMDDRNPHPVQSYDVSSRY